MNHYNKTVIISGIGGQDGFYLAHYLLELGYQVVGLMRRTSTPNNMRLRTLRGSPNLHLVHADITDLSSIQAIVRRFKPHEFYHLAAQSHVAFSWRYPITTAEITGIGTLNCLEAIKQEKPDCRFYFAGSSEQFGNPIFEGRAVSLNEESPMEPESPYAAAKVFGYNISRVYRRSFDMFTACGILFNHESPVRGEEFVTRKITSNLARVTWGLQEYVELGNMKACRDWGFAGDYVRAMHAMLQQDIPDDFVIATGNTYSVEAFFNACCEWFELDPVSVYRINPAFNRPKDVEVLLGDSTKAQSILGWRPECNFEALVDKMCCYDYHLQSPDPAYVRKADEYLF
jgi:GDPmannose 4,6-dehydratase